MQVCSQPALELPASLTWPQPGAPQLRLLHHGTGTARLVNQNGVPARRHPLLICSHPEHSETTEPSKAGVVPPVLDGVFPHPKYQLLILVLGIYVGFSPSQGLKSMSGY